MPKYRVDTDHGSYIVETEPPIPGMQKLGALPPPPGAPLDPGQFPGEQQPESFLTSPHGFIRTGLRQVGRGIAGLTGEDKAGAASDIIRGAGTAAIPAAIPLAAANLPAAATGLVAGGAGALLGGGAASLADATPGQQRLAEDVGGILGGGAGAKAGEAIPWSRVGRAALEGAKEFPSGFKFNQPFEWLKTVPAAMVRGFQNPPPPPNEFPTPYRGLPEAAPRTLPTPRPKAQPIPPPPVEGNEIPGPLLSQLPKSAPRQAPMRSTPSTAAPEPVPAPPAIAPPSPYGTHTELLRLIHAEGKNLELPGSPAGQGAHPVLSQAAKDAYGKGLSELSTEQLGKLTDFIVSKKRLPTAGELR